MRLRRTRAQRVSRREESGRRTICRLEPLEMRYLLDGNPVIEAYAPTGDVHEAVSSVRLLLSDPVLDAGARDVANYELLHLGADRVAGGGDDQLVRLLPQYVAGSTEINLNSTVDLSRWSEVDYSFPGGLFGEWRFDGDSVVQDINGAASFFVSDFDLINSRFEGRIQVVDAAGDDDVIGFVFGFQQDAESLLPDQYYLVSWKQSAQGGAEAGLKLAKITGTGGALQRPDLWNLESSDPFIDVLALGPGVGWQDGAAYDFAVDYASDGRIGVTIRQADNGAVVWTHQLTDAAPLGPGRVGFYNYSQANVRYQPLTHGDELADGYYQLTVNADPGGLQGLDGAPLDGDGDGVGGDDFVGTFSINTGPAAVTIDLTDESDTGLSADDLTRLRNIAFDVTVNKIGRVDFDFDGDAAFDFSQFFDAPGMQTISRSFAADGVFQVTSRFAPAAGDPVEATLNLRIDTDAPDVAPGVTEVNAGWSQYAVEFDEPMLADTFTLADVALFAPGAVPIEITGMETRESSFMLTFAPQVSPGNYRLVIGPDVADVAGNLMAGVAERIVAVDSDDFGPIVNGVTIQPNAIVLEIFDAGDVNASSASLPANYVLLATGGDGVFGDANDINLGDHITQIDFDPNTGRTTLSFDPPLADETYRLTVNGHDAGGVQDLVGNLLEGGDYVALLPLQTSSTLLGFDIVPESDSNIFTDNVTSDTTPTFELTINKAGSLELDYQNDGLVDERELYSAAGTFRFTPPALADRGYFAFARFTPAVGGPANAALSYVIDTLPPQVVTSAIAAQSPWASHVISFDGELLGSFDAADVRLVGPDGQVPNVEVRHVGGNSYELTFPTQTGDGNYYFEIGPEVADVAGNSMTSAQRLNLTLVPDVTGPGVAAFSPLGARNASVTTLDLAFGEAVVDFTTADVSIVGPLGPVVLANGAIESIDARTFRVTTPELAAEGTYSVRIGPEVRDLSGNRMATLYQGSFSIDTTGPAVVTVSPAGTIENELTTIDVSFDQRVDNLQADDLTLVGPNGGVPVEFISLLTDRDVRAYFAASRANGTYSLTVGPGITDTLGNPMAAPFVHQVTVALPDLQVALNAEVRRFGLPATANFGESLRPSWNVVNTGTATARGSWNTRVWLSRDELLDKFGANADIPLGDVQGTLRTLLPSAQSAHELLVGLPLSTSLATGEYRLLIEEDADNAVLEADDSNNFLASDPIIITRPTLPDLLVDQVTAPQFALPGGSTTVAYSLRSLERELTPAEGGFVDFYFSRDAATGTPGDDQLMATAPFTGPLGAEPLGQTASVLIPTTGVSGQYFVVARLRTPIVEGNSTNNAALSENAINVLAALTVTLNEEQLREDAANPASRGLVTRNGDLSLPLVVALTSSDATELNVPLNVTIPAGQSAAAFDVLVQADGVTDGNQLVTISATAANFPAAVAVVTVLDVDLPRLFLATEIPGLAEGATTVATLTREFASPTALTVLLSSNVPGQLTFPPSATIPAGGTEVSFEVTALDDLRVESTAAVIVEARGGGHRTGAVTLNISDNDVPLLELAFDRPSISEGAGARAALGTVTRAPISNAAIVVELTVDPGSPVTAPRTVTIPAGQASATYYIDGLDDLLVDGTQQAKVIARVRETGTTRVIESSAAAATIQVTDDDGPALFVSIDRDLAAEGIRGAAFVTVERNTPPDEDLVVVLKSSDPTELAVAGSVVIPAGQTSVSVPLDTLEDDAVDGNQLVSITATAAGYAPSSDSLIVSDADLPDLVPAQPVGPGQVATDQFFSLSFRVNNAGLSPAISSNAAGEFSGSWVDRVFLSSDNIIGDDILVGSFTFEGTLPVDLFYAREVTARAPRASGDYWIVLVTDVSEQVGEGVETNNARISVQPVHVAPAYTARVQSTVDVGIAGDRISLTGTATMAGGGPAVSSIVNVHVGFRGTTRVISALTNFAGQFQVQLESFPGQGGLYTIGAAHPGEAVAPVQDQFTLLGFHAALDQSSRSVLEGESFTGTITVSNDTNVALGGVQAGIIAQPANLEIALEYPSGDFLPGGGSLPIRYTVTARDASIPFGEVVLRIATQDTGAAELRLQVTVAGLTPQLSASTHQLQAAMLRGSQRTVEFQVTNTGSAPTGIVHVELPSVPWLSVATHEAIASLEPGESASVTLLLTPAADLPLTAFNGNLVLRAETGAYLSLPFTFRAVSDAQGDVAVTVVDELFYYTPEAPKVAGATVTLRDVLTGESISTIEVDGAGDYLINDVREGYYSLEVQAPEHESYSATVFVAGGILTTELVFISQETVTYVWSVTETEIEDRTNITIESVFETNVPTPVVVIENPLIDLAPLEFVGDFFQIDMKITNYGLIAAQGLKLNFGSHPYYAFEPLITDIGVLPAKSSLTIPVIVRRMADENSGGGGGGGGTVPCDITAWLDWSYICGPQDVNKSTGILIINIDAECGVFVPSGGGGVGGGGVAGGGAGNGPGPGGVTPVVFETDTVDCDFCLEVTLEKDFSSYFKPIVKTAENAVNAYLAAAPAKVALDVTASAALKTCCDTPLGIGLEFDAEASITAALIVGKGIDKEFEISYEDETTGGTITISGEGFFGATATFSAGLSGHVSSGCNFDQPNVTIGGSVGVEFNVGVKGSVTATLEIAGLETEYDAASVEGGLFGGVTYSVSYSSSGGFSSCLASEEGIYLAASATLFGRTWSLFGKDNPDTDELDESRIYLVEPIACESSAPPEEGSVNPFAAGELMTTLALKADAQRIIEARKQALRTLPDPHPLAASVPPSGFERFASPPPGDDVCARVTLQINQEAVMTRTAFIAALELTNSSASDSLLNIAVAVEVFDEDGNQVNDLFGIRAPKLVNLSAVDGTGLLGTDSTGSVSWTLVPTDQAAPDKPTVYRVGGLLSYTQRGLRITIPLEPISITVRPDAALNLKYFHQRDVFSDDPHTDPVEPALPYTLAVMVENNGAGAARNMRITSAQPQIIENEKGLLIDFQIIATEVFSKFGFSSLTPSLIANFGDIAPDEIKIARWLLTSTLQGQFIDYKATFEHIDGLGDPRLSLIKSVKIFEMIRQVRSPDDELPDFLTNEVPDAPEDLPDTIHLSDGTVHSVALAGAASFDAAPTAFDTTLELTVDMADGWSYLRTPDLGDGKWRLARVVRSDGAEINPDNFWQTDRTFIEQGLRPRLENNLHLVDRDSTGRYTLYYAPLDQAPPSVENLQDVTPNPRNAPLDTLDVRFTEALSDFALTALALTRDGSPNLIGPAVTITQLDDTRTRFRIGGLAGVTGDDGEYLLSVDAAQVQDEFGNTGYGVASVSWVNGSLAVAVESIDGPSGTLVNAPLDEIQVRFTRAIDFATLDASDLRLTHNGQAIDLRDLAFSQTSDRGYAVAGFTEATSIDGQYEFCVNARNVADSAARAGVGGKCVAWSVDATAPRIILIEEVLSEKVPEGLGALDVTFSEPIRVDSFDWRDLSLTAAGDVNLIDESVVVSPLGGNRYRIRGLTVKSQDAAEYSLSVDAAGVLDLAANAGVDASSVVFDRLSPSPLGDVMLTPATVIGPDAWQANSIALVLSGPLPEVGAKLNVFDRTTNKSLGAALIDENSFTLSMRLETSGQHELELRTSDAAGNTTLKMIKVFVRIITVGDLNDVRNGFGMSGENLPGDFDGNGAIDIQDLNFVRNNLGAVSSAPPALRLRDLPSAAGFESESPFHLAPAKTSRHATATDRAINEWGVVGTTARPDSRIDQVSALPNAVDCALLMLGDADLTNSNVRLRQASNNSVRRIASVLPRAR